MIANESATELDYLEKRKEIERKNLVLQSEIASDLKEIKDKATHIGKYALVVGGAFVVTYFVVGIIFSSDDDDKDDKRIYFAPAPSASPAPENMLSKAASNPIYQSIMGHIATFLLAIAKEKLADLLEQLIENDKGSRTGSDS
ncbi:MAG: hypothetical protein SFY32_17560 [Bacteroidota bacterium]|nr:hypothetical protein [Bacteroidota bacterium]